MHFEQLWVFSGARRLQEWQRTLFQVLKLSEIPLASFTALTELFHLPSEILGQLWQYIPKVLSISLCVQFNDYLGVCI